MSTTAIKLGSLAIKTLAKPIATQIKQQAREHQAFRGVCIFIAQRLHRVDMRLRLGLLRDTSANLEKQEVAEKARRNAEALRKMKEAEAINPGITGRVRSDVLSPEAAAKEAKKEKEKEVVKAPRIRPLSESKAIDAGANFISEAFLFSVAASLVLLEQLRSRRKEANRRDIVQERITLLEDRNRQDEQRLAELEERDRKTEERVLSLEEQLWKAQGNKGDFPGKKNSEIFKTWEPKPLWIEEKKPDDGMWKSLVMWVKGHKEDTEAEVVLKNT
ncbi:optic atrophy 3 protein-domain-containing protein [Geopyxis carbonaria]|nr:optic atrophy 3 protein-domain-containing protein [Geopyxis carbonaria]